MKALLALAILMFAPSCALLLRLETLETSDEVLAGITRKTDPFRGTEIISTPIHHPDAYWWLYIRRVRLIKPRIDGQHPAIHQIYFIYSAHGWQFFHAAVDVHQQELDFVQISRKVGYRGKISEHFAVNVSREYLESRVETGLTLAIYNDGNNRSTVYLPPQYIQGYLAALDL